MSFRANAGILAFAPLVLLAMPEFGQLMFGQQNAPSTQGPQGALVAALTPDNESAAPGPAVPGVDISASADASPQAPAPAAPKPAPAANASNWHIDHTGYLWLPGLHGDVNAFDYNVGFKASPGDLLSHVDIGIMDFVGVRYKRFVFTNDFFFISLSANRSRVFDLLPDQPEISANVKSRPLVFTQKIGFRLIDNPRIQIDGLVGYRFWHLGTTLSLTPPQFAHNLYTSHNWTDPVIGSRIIIPLSPKLVAEIAGDVGGWGAGSQLEYQIVGALAYRIKRKISLNAGWRYLYVDYSGGRSQFDSRLAMSGLVLGSTYTFK